MGTDVLSNHKRIQVVAFTKASDECVELVDALPKSFHEYEGVFDFREVIARDDDEAARALVTKFGLFKSKDKCAELVMFPSTDDEDDDRDPIVFKPSVATIEGFAPDAVGRFFLDNVVDTTIPVTANHKRIQVVAFTKASDECVELVDALPKSFHEYEGVFDFREVNARDDDEAARALVTKFGLFKSKDKCAELVMFP